MCPFTGELYVYGKVLGNVAGIDDASRLTICEGGEIRGDVRVASVVVNGSVEGDIFAKTRVEIAARASLQGNVYDKLIEMHSWVPVLKDSWCILKSYPLRMTMPYLCRLASLMMY